MPPSTQHKPLAVYQLKVTLKGTKPPIWRRIQVTGDTSLLKLHQILQIAMGWYDSHLHQFIVWGTYYGIPDPDFPYEIKSETRAKLSQVVAQEKDKFTYEYDFGDSWEHEIVVEKILQPETGTHYPVCLAGKRACPPEDCGGVWGYADLLEAIRDPEHPEHDEWCEWVGDEFDPNEFDLEEVNHELKMLR
jgi:hypothetical protein